MKTTICIIRHGQTDWNKIKRIQGTINNPLNEEGINQAKELGKHILECDSNWDIIICSPLNRAIQTCEQALSIAGIDKEVIIRDDVIERDFGEADGIIITDDIYLKIVNEEYKGMELAVDIKKRAYNFYLDMLKKYPGKRILVFTHSHFVKSFFMNFDKSITYNKTLINNCSMNYLINEDDKITIKYNQ